MKWHQTFFKKIKVIAAKNLQQENNILKWGKFQKDTKYLRKATGPN